MLDQNTDRMWFVIGAVIVGAAIIFIANGTIPEIFASVTDSFEGASESALSVIDDIEPRGNLINLNIHTVLTDRRIDHKNTGEIIENPNNNWYSVVGPIEVSPNTSYFFTAKQSLAAPLVGMYDKDDNYLGYAFRGGAQQKGVSFTTDENTAYVLVSAGDTRLPEYEYAGRPEESPMEDWQLFRE